MLAPKDQLSIMQFQIGCTSLSLSAERFRRGSRELRVNHFICLGEIPKAGSEGLLDPYPEKICATSIERTAKDFTLLSPPFSVIAPLCAGGGGGGGRSHYTDVL